MIKPWRPGSRAVVLAASLLLLQACLVRPEGEYVWNAPFEGERIVLASNGSFQYSARSDNGGIYFKAEGRWYRDQQSGMIVTVIEHLSNAKESCCDPLRHSQEWLLTRHGLVRYQRVRALRRAAKDISQR